MATTAGATLVVALVSIVGGAPRVGDWPMFACDRGRSAATAAPLPLPLVEAWIHRPAHPPEPAWPDPARHDYWHYKQNLTPRVTYDRAFHVAAAGSDVFYGSSSDDSLVCLDARNGQVRWSFYTEGPVRMAPTAYERCVLAGSDDGWVYCLAAADGRLLWKRLAGLSDSRCIGNGRVISRWPVRSGIVVVADIAYCAAGLFPTSEGSFLCGWEALTGREVLRQSIDHSCQGYLLASEETLIAPSGRSSPALFDRRSGRKLGELKSPGGQYVMLSDDVWAAGAGDGPGELSLGSRETPGGFFSLDGLHLIASEQTFFVHTDGQLAALDRSRFLPLAREQALLKAQYAALRERKQQLADAQRAAAKDQMELVEQQIEACWRWRSACRDPYALILAGDVLLAGGEGRVAAYRADDGREVWSAPVEGRAYGLAAAGGRLLVSTSTGAVYCFAARDERLAESIAPASADIPAPAPFAQDPHDREFQRAAEAAIAWSGADRGFCVVLDVQTGQLAQEIAQRTRLSVIAVAKREAQLERARRRLQQAGLCGSRIALHHVAGERLPYPPYLANLVVSEGAVLGGELPGPRQVHRLLRPCGGVACLGGGGEPQRPSLQAWLDQAAAAGFTASFPDQQGPWAVLRRGPLSGAGRWTHSLAGPGNTSCSQDLLVAGPLRIQWFGEPGPRPMADRHHRIVAPLANDGRLFIPGDNQVLAVDAYNGAPLWRRDIPESRRLGAFLDCSNMALGDDALYYAAQDKCLMLGVSDGTLLAELELPRGAQDGSRHWGYVAPAGGLLLGSVTKAGASYYQQSRKAEQALWFDDMALVTSEQLFARRRNVGKLQWSYQDGLIINTTITAGGGRVYFLESHSPKALANDAGRAPMADFLQGPNYLVALDLATGRLIWKKPVDLENCRHIVYLSYAAEKLVLTGNRYLEKRLWYFFDCLDAATGAQVWRQAHNSGYPPGGDHGEQNRHPTIVGDTVYAYPLAYELHTGQRVEGWRFDRQGHGCGNLSASAACLFWRGGNPWRWDLKPSQEPQRLNSVSRLGCWINAIPAGGLLLIPEASSGCTCSYPLQTSLAYAPANVDD